MAGTRSLRIWTGIHKWTSLVSMLFLLMLCITGLPLIFHDEIDAWLEQEIEAPDLPGRTGSASVDRAIAAARQARPQDHVLFVNWRSSGSDVVVVAMSATPVPQPGGLHRMIFDARSAALLGEEAPHRSVIDVILAIHKDMFLGLSGELFLGAMGLLLAASIVSGAVVYAPFMRRLKFGEIRRSSPRVKRLDRHNLLGVVTLLWLLVVGLTGTINTLAIPLFDLWRGQTLPVLLKPFLGKPVAAAPSIDEALVRVRERLPGALITSVTMPTAARFGSPQHLVVWTKGDTPLTARMSTPVLVSVDPAAAVEVPVMPWYLRSLQVSRPLHFGDYGGMPLKIIWALLDVAAIVVLVTGLKLWTGKLRGTKAAVVRSPRHLSAGAVP